MKLFLALISASILLLGSVAQAAPGAADQKWLLSVQKIIAKGETSIITSSQERVKMLKEWAASNGYAFLVGRVPGGYEIALFPALATK